MDAVKTQQFIDGHHDIDPDNAAFEFMLNSMRLVEGIKTETFAQHTGLDIEIIQDKIKLAQERDLLEKNLGNNKSRLQATEHGHRFLNDLTALFLPE